MGYQDPFAVRREFVINIFWLNRTFTRDINSELCHLIGISLENEVYDPSLQCMWHLLPEPSRATAAVRDL